MISLKYKYIMYFLKKGKKMRNIIEVTDLYKSFGDVDAVKGLSFVVKEGELFAFLGENGAGKSTTINMICSQLLKDSGRIIIDELDTDASSYETKVKLGVVFQKSVLDSALSVYENLKSRAALYGIFGEELEKRVSHLSEILNFTDLLNRRVGKLSGGQRRRIDIARALLHNPKILILDEPTTGLDPQTRKTLWSVISDLRKNQNLTVFLTTHYMEEAADADYVVIIDKGEISAKGTPLELKNKYTRDFVTVYGISEEEAKKLGGSYKKIRDAYQFSVSSTKEAASLISKHPEIFSDFEVTKGKMDDVFLAVTGKKLSISDSEVKKNENNN